MYDIALHKNTHNDNIRYYYINIEQNLFGDFAVERIYGNTRFKSHTGKRVDFFPTLESAKVFFDDIVNKKRNRGYQ